MNNRRALILSGSISLALIIVILGILLWTDTREQRAEAHFLNEDGILLPDLEIESVPEPEPEPVPELDKEAYDAIMRRLAHVEETEADEESEAVEEEPLWPVEAAYPNVGAILPFHRIVAYYGNFYSTRMGVLGEYSRPVVIEKLRAESAKWEQADPETPVMPAIDYIAVVAQAGPGKDGMYRFRMPDDHIERALSYAEEVGGIVILEVQAGRANVQTEVEALEKYLVLPQVHLAIDPEFAMQHTGSRPGLRVGFVTAEEVNTAAEYLAGLVRDHNLPPKVLVVHRYTQAMVRNATDITPLPEVQIVMDMDGWGTPGAKYNTYNSFIVPYPVQFTGFKLFYKNDLKGGGWVLTPPEILKLTPQPIFIQYQ